jgi:signal transduction histidine kinase/CheY-like chemotaxis protein
MEGMALGSTGNGAAPATADESLVQAFIHDRFADMFLGQNRRAQLGLLVAASLVAFIWYQRTQAAVALFWMGAVVVVTALRYVGTERFVRARGGRQTTRRITAVLLVNGLLMAMPLTAFHRLTELERAAVSIILIATATASVATTAGFRSIFIAYAAPMLVPLSVAWAVTRSEDHGAAAAVGLGLLIFMFLLFLLSIGQQSRQVFEEAGRFRYGEQQLNRELSQALAQAGEANRAKTALLADLERALGQAGEANRAKTQFLAAASHDLRQPIHSMNVLVAALRLREMDERSREIVLLLDSVNQMLSRQLDSLLDVSKLDAGIVKPERAVHALHQLLAEHQQAQAPVARERGLNLELAVADEASASTDSALFGRVLGNLTDNAFKFTRRGGSVKLTLHVTGGRAVITVADTGIGIAPEEHERVFREFYQVGNVERDRSKGLGLGLSIVRRLCQLLGVEVQLASMPGVGTTVTLTLPVVAPVRAAQAAAVVSRVPPGLQVLVVDDEEIVRHSMRLLLAELGCVVHLADGTEQARQLSAQHGIDVVLSDHRLREGDSGLLAIRAVQARHAGVRAALVTGDTAPDRIQEAQAAGVRLLHKPVTLPELLSVLGPGSA